MNLEFNLQTQLILAALSLGTLGLLFSFISIIKQRKLRRRTELLSKDIEDLDETVTRQREYSEINAQRLADQSRRIAWLETRIRQQKPSGFEDLDDIESTDATKLNITERRHRVITLAARGQNVESISTSLGMLPGEVELIIDMNQAAINSK